MMVNLVGVCPIYHRPLPLLYNIRGVATIDQNIPCVIEVFGILRLQLLHPLDKFREAALYRAAATGGYRC